MTLRRVGLGRPARPGRSPGRSPGWSPRPSGRCRRRTSLRPPSAGSSARSSCVHCVGFSRPLRKGRQIVGCARSSPTMCQEAAVATCHRGRGARDAVVRARPTPGARRRGDRAGRVGAHHRARRHRPAAARRRPGAHHRHRAARVAEELSRLRGRPGRQRCGRADGRARPPVDGAARQPLVDASARPGPAAGRAAPGRSASPPSPRPSASAIVDEQLAELREAERVHDTFTELSIAEAGPSEILEAAQRLSGAAVVLESEQHQVLDYRAGPGDVAGSSPTGRARSPASTLPGPHRVGRGQRLAGHPAGRRERGWGRLVLAGPASRRSA